MQIILKQREIEAALRAYVVAEGINLNGKAVEIAFTAGRKEAGIIAEIDIEDALVNLSGMPVGLPGNLSVATCVSKEAAAQVAAEPAVQEPEPAPEPELMAEEPQVEVTAKSATSLFG